MARCASWSDERIAFGEAAPSKSSHSLAAITYAPANGTTNSGAIAGTFASPPHKRVNTLIAYWIAAARSSGVTTFTAQCRSRLSSALWLVITRFRSSATDVHVLSHVGLASWEPVTRCEQFGDSAALSCDRGGIDDPRAQPPPTNAARVRHNSRSPAAKGPENSTRGRTDVLSAQCGVAARDRDVRSVHPGRAASRSGWSLRDTPISMESRVVHGRTTIGAGARRVTARARSTPARVERRRCPIVGRVRSTATRAESCVGGAFARCRPVAGKRGGECREGIHQHAGFRAIAVQTCTTGELTPARGRLAR